jgi:hypothetical protein
VGQLGILVAIFISYQNTSQQFGHARVKSLSAVNWIQRLPKLLAIHTQFK